MIGAVSGGGMTFSGGGTTTLSGVNTYKGATLINAGVLALQGGAAPTIGSSTNINVAAGAQLDVTGQVVTFGLAFGQSLTGNGSIKGNVAVGNGLVIPGSNSIGTLTFSNSLALSSLASGSTSIFKISKSPLTNDFVKIFGALTNGGTLIVTNIGVATLTNGDSFKLFNAASYSGSFANVILPPLGVNLAWNTNVLNTSGVISVVSTAPPNPPVFGLISISANNFIFSGTGGVANANFYLLGSTNLSTPVSNWTRLLTNQFDNSGDFNFTNAINSNTAQSFYLLQLQ